MNDSQPDWAVRAAEEILQGSEHNAIRWHGEKDGQWQWLYRNKEQVAAIIRANSGDVGKLREALDEVVKLLSNYALRSGNSFMEQAIAVAKAALASVPQPTGEKVNQRLLTAAKKAERQLSRFHNAQMDSPVGQYFDNETLEAHSDICEAIEAAESIPADTLTARRILKNAKLRKAAMDAEALTDELATVLKEAKSALIAWGPSPGDSFLLRDRIDPLLARYNATKGTQ